MHEISLPFLLCLLKKDSDCLLDLCYEVCNWCNVFCCWWWRKNENKSRQVNLYKKEIEALQIEMLSRAKKTENRVRGIYMTKMGLWGWLTADVTAVVQLLSCVLVCHPMDCSTPGFPGLHHLLEFAQTRVYWVGDVIQPSHPQSSLSPPAFSLSQHQGLSQQVCSSHQRSKYWSFSFSISPSNEYSGLISSRIDWFDLLAVQVTLKSLLQHHNLKPSILRHSVFSFK